MPKYQYVVTITPTEDGCEARQVMLVDGKTPAKGAGMDTIELLKHTGEAFVRTVSDLQDHLAGQADTQRAEKRFEGVLVEVLKALASRGVGSNEFPARTETVDTDTDAPARTETVDTATDAPARTETNDTPIQ